MCSTRADGHAWQSVHTGKLIFISQRLVVVQTGRPIDDAALEPRQRTSQDQVNNLVHISHSLADFLVTPNAGMNPVAEAPAYEPKQSGFRSERACNVKMPASHI